MTDLQLAWRALRATPVVSATAATRGDAALDATAKVQEGWR